MPSTSPLTTKLKVQLKLSISRLRMVQQKETAVAKQQRRAMVGLLESGKDASARIRVENIIHADLHTELLEILELYCELLLARAGLLESHGKECPEGLEEAVHSLLYAAPKVDGVKELGVVRALLAEKYGKEFVRLATVPSEKVPARVLERLKVDPPDPVLVQDYLAAIADAYDVDWPVGTKARRAAEQAEAEAAAEAAAREEGEDEDGDDDDDNPSGGQKIKAVEAPLRADDGALSRATPTPPRSEIGGPRSPVSVVPPSPSTDNVRPKVILPGRPTLTPNLEMADAGLKKKALQPGDTAEGSKKEDGGSSGGPGGKIPDVDELAKRFAMLKR